MEHSVKQFFKLLFLSFQAVAGTVMVQVTTEFNIPLFNLLKMYEF